MNRRRGFALPTALMMLVIIGAIAAVMPLNSRHDIARAQVARDGLRAKAAADGAVALTTFELLAVSADGRTDRPPTRISLEVGGIPVSVDLEDEEGKVDLNAAPPTLLAAYLRSAGLPADQAEGIADRIADFRDADSLRRVAGAEDDDYETGDAKDAPFLAVEELGQVSGSEAVIRPDIMSGLTVHAHRAQIDPTVAVPGTPFRDCDHSLRLDSLGQDRLSLLAPSRRRTYTLRAHAELGGTGFTRRAVVMVRPHDRHAFAILDWRGGGPPAPYGTGCTRMAVGR